MAYVFDPETLHGIVRKVVARRLDSREAIFDAITQELDFAYPGKVAIGTRRWIFNNAGGAMGQMALLHVSLGEYLLFFGTPVGTEGHSGRYAADVWDFVVDGEMWGYVEGQTDRSVVHPGDAHHLEGRVAKGYRIPDHAWMLEYARGPILSMFPFGLADTLFSTLDLSVLGRTLSQASSLMVRHALGRGTTQAELADPEATVVLVPATGA